MNRILIILAILATAATCYGGSLADKFRNAARDGIKNAPVTAATPTLTVTKFVTYPPIQNKKERYKFHRDELHMLLVDGVLVWGKDDGVNVGWYDPASKLLVINSKRAFVCKAVSREFKNRLSFGIGADGQTVVGKAAVGKEGVTPLANPDELGEAGESEFADEPDKDDGIHFTDYDKVVIDGTETLWVKYRYSVPLQSMFFFKVKDDKTLRFLDDLIAKAPVLKGYNKALIQRDLVTAAKLQEEILVSGPIKRAFATMDQDRSSEYYVAESMAKFFDGEEWLEQVLRKNSQITEWDAENKADTKILDLTGIPFYPAQYQQDHANIWEQTIGTHDIRTEQDKGQFILLYKDRKLAPEKLTKKIIEIHHKYANNNK